MTRDPHLSSRPCRWNFAALMPQSMEGCVNPQHSKARVSEAQRGPINHVLQVRLLDSRFVFSSAGYANWNSGQTQNLVLVGSTPTSANVSVV